MTNEAVLRNRLGSVDFDVVVAEDAGLEKGTVLKLSADRTGAASSADNDLFLGITTREHEADTGKTRVSVNRGPAIWDMVDSGAGMTLGDICMIKGANLVATTDATATEQAQNVGLVLETATASETVQVFVGCF